MNDYKFHDWIGQKIYNERVDVEERLYTKTQLKKYFHLKLKEDATPIEIEMDFVIHKSGETIEVCHKYNFYKIDQAEETEQSNGRLTIRNDRYNDIEYNDIENVELDIKNKTVVVTGALQKYTRAEIKVKLESLGARVSGSVSKKTDYLIVGINAGSKYTKAKELGIPIVSESILELI